VLIAVDTLRADHVGCYGYDRPTTPNIDRLAADALRYERAYAQAPWTTPSLGSLLSSSYPSALGIQHEASRLPSDALLLPEVLRDAGWTAGAVVSHSFCSSRWGFDRGFDSFDESEVRGQRAVTSPGVTDRALDFLDRHGAEPFFLFVHYFDPHFALIEHEGFAFRDAAEPYSGPVRSPVPFLVFGRKDQEVTSADAREMRRIYDSEIALTDHHIGRLLDALRERGLYEPSIVVLTADHGEEFLDHGRVGHTKTLYRELIRVPLLVKLPGRRGRVVTEPVGLIDVFPTILDALDLEIPTSLQGTSLLRSVPPRPVFSETQRQARLRSVVDGDFKLMIDLDRGTRELYDLGRDPLERMDVSQEQPARRRELERLLSSWAKASRRSKPTPPPVELSPEERERLRALGYGQ